MMRNIFVFTILCTYVVKEFAASIVFFAMLIYAKNVQK